MPAESPGNNTHGHDGDKRRRDRRTSSLPRSRNISRQSKNDKNNKNATATTSSSSCRRGLRIFIGSANLGNALPDPDSLSAWLPHHGKIHHVLNPNVKSSSVVEGVSKESWNNVDIHGKIEVIAVGMQESVAGSNPLTATGLTALFTGTNIKERKSFTNALGDLGKPIDAARTKVTEMIGTQAEVGGTKKLKERVTSHVGEDYTMMAEYQQGEMVFYLFVRNDLTSISSVTGLQAHNCGIGSVMANKGGIATILTVGTTRLSFLSLHLAAGHGLKHYEERNSNMGEIIRGTHDPTLSVHHAFVFGDLNYRFSLAPSSTGPEPPEEDTRLVCQTIVDAEDWATMNKHDELGRALREKKILVGFQTHPIRTCPTYRCERKQGVHYDYERIPSHTDRILWKSVEETPRSVEALLYEPIPDFSTSDHKPVRGVFFLPNRPSLRLNPEKTILNLTLKGFKCTNLRPASNPLHSDVDTYLDFQLQPSILELKSNNKQRRGRTYTINSTDNPSWPKEDVKFQIDVSSKKEIHGAYLYIKCMNDNAVLGDSLLGTVVLDLEHIIRRSLGVIEWKDDVERHFLRSGKDVGKLFCGIDINWDKNRRPHQQPTRARGVRSKSRVKASRSKSRVKASSAESEKSLLYLSHYMTKLEMPSGVLSTVVRNYHSCEKRYWYIDNSSSMKKIDSHLMGDNFERIKVSRWEELSECVCFHSKMSAKCFLPTTFSLMNSPSSGSQQFDVCCSNESDVEREVDQVHRIMTAGTPAVGKTPLLECISDFKNDISREASQLSSKGKHVTLVMCTQGLPTGRTGSANLAALRKFTHSVYSLSKLPVKIVIRLCTNDEKTTRLYNGLDSKLDNCECIDDWWGESLEVYLHNPWLCYGFGMHRLREAGLLWGLFNNLDERQLDLDEIHQFATSFFIGENESPGLPHPRDWKSFMQSLSELVKKEKLQWNPVKKKRTPWINLSKLESMYQPAQHRGNARAPRESPRSSQQQHQQNEKAHKLPSKTGAEKGESSRPSQRRNQQHEEHRKPPPKTAAEKEPSAKPSQQNHQQHEDPRKLPSKPTPDVAPPKEVTLHDVLRSWSHQPPNFEKLHPLHHLLVTLPTTFPPVNERVEPHEYFSKWTPISGEVFLESGDELDGLLKRATRKVKIFLHPDKLPKDLTETQSFLFRAIWDVILESEAPTLK